MDYKFLHRVLDQIVNETRIDHEKNEIYVPFTLSSLPLSFSFFLSFYHLSFERIVLSFSDHCKNVYGLNKDEVDYVWNEYRKIIYNKING